MIWGYVSNLMFGVYLRGCQLIQVFFGNTWFSDKIKQAGAYLL